MKIIGDSFIRELGREKSESYRALYQGLGWFLTVSLAFLALIGQKMVGSEIQVGAGHLWGLVIVFCITLRYFCRGLLDYINMQAWVKLFNSYTRVIHADTEVERENLHREFWRLYELYVFDWKSPIPLRKAIWDMMRIGYLHLILLEVGMLGYVLVNIGAGLNTLTCWSALGLLVAGLILEGSGFNYKRFEYAVPASPAPPADAGTKPSAPAK